MATEGQQQKGWRRVEVDKKKQTRETALREAQAAVDAKKAEEAWGDQIKNSRASRGSGDDDRPARRKSLDEMDNLEVREASARLLAAPTRLPTLDTRRSPLLPSAPGGRKINSPSLRCGYTSGSPRPRRCTSGATWSLRRSRSADRFFHVIIIIRRGASTSSAREKRDRLFSTLAHTDTIITTTNHHRRTAARMMMRTEHSSRRRATPSRTAGRGSGRAAYSSRSTRPRWTTTAPSARSSTKRK